MRGPAGASRAGTEWGHGTRDLGGCGHRAVGKHQVEHLVRAAAADVCAIYARRTPVPAGKTTLLVLSVDGKGIVMRPDDLREATRKAAERAWRTFRTRLSAGEKTCRKRMAPWRSSTTPTRPRAVRLTSSPPCGRAGRRTPRKGPKARQKWLTASVQTTPTRSSPPRSTRPKPVTRSTTGTGWSWSTAPPTSWN
ncbi:hypothetical protein [Streptomyces sp. NPDC020951]|uniref:hypothetical protein n=1 Tax=Streptomyces sp. NPDC020951 TaxID=3365104 RepID=UPI0037AE2D22